MKATAVAKTIEAAIPTYRRMLFLRASKMLMSNKDLAEDFAQETMLRALEQKKRFNDENHLKAWMLSTIRFIIYDYYRSKQVTREPVGRADDVAIVDIPIMPEQETKAQWRDFLNTFSLLNKQDRRILWGTMVDGISYDDMAKQEKTTEPSIRGKIYRAKQFLKAQHGYIDPDNTSLGVVTGDNHIRADFEG